MNKFKLMVLVLVTCLLCGCGVQKEKEQVNTDKNMQNSIEKNEQEDVKSNDKLVYKDEDVTVKEVEILDNPKYVEYQWNAVNSDEIIQESDVILEGTIKEIKEIAIEAQHFDVTRTIYKTILTIEADEILADNIGGLSKGDALQIAVCVSTREYTEYVAEFVEKQNYLFFIKKTVVQNEDPLKLYKYCEYYIDSPIQCIAPVIDQNNYLVDRIMVENIHNDFCVNLGDIVFSDEKNAEIVYKQMYSEKEDMVLVKDKVGENTIFAKDVMKIIEENKYSSYNAFEMYINESYVVNKNAMRDGIASENIK